MDLRLLLSPVTRVSRGRETKHVRRYTFTVLFQRLLLGVRRCELWSPFCNIFINT